MRLLSLFLLSLLAACATVDTFNKRIVVANSAIEQAAATTGILYDAQKMSKEEAIQVHKMLSDARDIVEMSRRVYAVSKEDGATKLSEAMAILVEVNRILEKHQ